AFAATLGADTWSQSGISICTRSAPGQPCIMNTTPAIGAHAEFTFVRLAYPASGGPFGSERWLIDWPDAEQHLMDGVRRLTRVRAASEGTYLSIMDDRLFEYPWIYAVEVGGWTLSDM